MIHKLTVVTFVVLAALAAANPTHENRNVRPIPIRPRPYPPTVIGAPRDDNSVSVEVTVKDEDTNIIVPWGSPWGSGHHHHGPLLPPFLPGPPALLAPHLPTAILLLIQPTGLLGLQGAGGLLGLHGAGGLLGLQGVGGLFGLPGLAGLLGLPGLGGFLGLHPGHGIIGKTDSTSSSSGSSEEYITITNRPPTIITGPVVKPQPPTIISPPPQIEVDVSISQEEKNTPITIIEEGVVPVHPIHPSY